MGREIGSRLEANSAACRSAAACRFTSKKTNEDTMIKGMAKKIGVGLLAYAGTAQAAYQWNLPSPVTRVASEIYNLHLIMMGIILVIFIGVFGVMFYSIYAHRRSVGHKAEHFHENTTVEIIWTVIPLVILIAMAWPATKTLLEIKDTTTPDITIKATGYQWKWGYDYLRGEGEGISFLSNLATPQDQISGGTPKGDNYLREVDNPLVVPVGRKIRILATANDVIHAWMVPEFGVKQDAIPGFVRDTWFRAEKEGVFRGQCAELCGKDHGFMPIVVEVVSAEKYAAWVGEQKRKMAAVAEDPNKKWSLAELKARGEKIYATNCVACHQANGQGVKGAFPALDGSKLVNGPRGRHIEIVLNGKQGTAMAPFGKQLSDTEIAAVIAYERNAWSNRSGDVIQPSDIATARRGGVGGRAPARGPGEHPTQRHNKGRK
jgi:cytochrome c oxidase subunit 2